MVRNLVARVGAMRWAKPVALGLVAAALVALGGFGSYAVRGQAPGPGGSSQPSGVQAADAAGSGSIALCGQMAFSSGFPEITTLAASPAFTVLATAALSHNCTGPVNVAFTGTVRSLGSASFIRIDATCTGGGCPVGTTTIAEPFVSGGQDVSDFNDGATSGIFLRAVTVTGTFPSLPRGRYTITARAQTFGGGGATTVALRSLTVQSYGPPTPALP